MRSGGAGGTDQERRVDGAAAPDGSDRQRGLDPFWRAAVRLRRQPNRPGVAEAAAAALCELARCEASSLLAAALRVDLESPSAGWTVACYEVGDNAPSALHEYADPVTAVEALVGCGTPSHIASELVCNGDEGLQWVAMTRTQSRIRFQLPDALNTTARSSARADVARQGWREQLELRRELVRGPAAPEPARIRAPRACDLAPVPPRPDAPSDGLARGPVHAVEPHTSKGEVDPWVDELGAAFGDDEGFSHAALAALGWCPDEPTAPPPASATPETRPPDGITARHLNSAVRTALAGAVPYLEQYFLEAIADRAAALSTTTDEDAMATVNEALTALLRGQQELAAELQNMQRRHLSEVLDLEERIRCLESQIDSRPPESRDDARADGRGHHWPLGLPRPSDVHGPVQS